MKKSGRISLLSSFEADDEKEQIKLDEINLNLRPFSRNKVSDVKNQLERGFDLSSIKDRVTQMELNEEIILEGEAAEALLAAENEESMIAGEGGGEKEDFELLRKIEKAKEARKRATVSHEEEEEILEDFIPVTTKAEYWLRRDTRESEEAFQSNSRLMREDLFNERELDDSAGSFTSFIGRSSDGSGKGLMMTSKMLERDIRSELYDFELQEEEEEAAEIVGGSNLKKDEEEEGLDVIWQKGQVAKGIEKGWAANQPYAADDSIFLAKQNKLASYIPPQNYFISNFSIGDALKPEPLHEIESNLEKIGLDSQALEAKIEMLKSDISQNHSELERLKSMESFFMKYSRFIEYKLKDLNEIEEILSQDAETKSAVRWKWEHFFDDVEEEEGDLLDLPRILALAQEYNVTVLDDLDTLKGLTELFIRYHFLAMHLDDREAGAIWDQSGLREALKPIPEDQINLLIDSIFGADNPISSAFL